MKWPFSRPALTPEQLAVEQVLTDAAGLEIGGTLELPPIATDGFGGLLVKRHNRYTFVFQRTGSQERSRWADTPDQARQEIEAYLQTGKLLGPDRICGW